MRRKFFLQAEERLAAFASLGRRDHMRIEIEVAGIGQALAAARAATGQRAYVVAGRAGIHPDTLRAIERGRRECSGELANRIKTAVAEGAQAHGR